jgi:hypothetical protein
MNSTGRNDRLKAHKTQKGIKEIRGIGIKVSTCKYCVCRAGMQTN